jgi:hypothetical protein
MKKCVEFYHLGSSLFDFFYGFNIEDIDSVDEYSVPTGLMINGLCFSIDMLSLRDKNRYDRTKNKPCDTSKFLLKQEIVIPVMYIKRLYTVHKFR